MKVYDAVANAFVKEGTAAVFGLLGDGQLTWWSSIAKYPEVKIIDVRDEGAALAMAEGWARATGKVGVCSVTHGPGISRLATSLITATRSGTPIVVYTSKTALNNEHASKTINQDRLVHGTEAGYIEVLSSVGYKHPVVAFEGDGGAMQNIQELDTASRLGVKLLYVIINDEAYGAEYHKLRAKGLDGNLSVVRSPDFAAVGRAFGCRGRRASTLEEVGAGVDEFLGGDGPMVLDVRISRNVVSIPVRRVHFGQDA